MCKSTDFSWYQILYAYGPSEPFTKLLSLIRNRKIKIEDLKYKDAVLAFISLNSIADKIVSDINLKNIVLISWESLKASPYQN